MPQEPPINSGPAQPVRARTGVVTLLFTDIVSSTALKQRLGDQAGAALIQQQRALVRQLLATFPGAEEIETAGDSFLLSFSKPSDAVRFALVLQGRLRGLNQGQPAELRERIGIHLGEVVIEQHEAGHKPKDLYGLQIDTCARVMSLAKGGQVLMSRGVFDSARQVLKGEDIEGVGALEWLNHGPYLLKGIQEPVEICEVRKAGGEALSPPTSSEKAQRQVRADEEPVLGWRPAVGQLVPNTRWILEKRLGEGGFGEVWLGRHQHTKEARVFKFCFQAERVRFLKREITLFRVLKERVGDHPNIVRLHDVYLDQPPFYVEMDYVEGSDLRTWCETQGGINAVALETRLEIVAQIADALQAAHDAGVIHRDIKPANILVGSPKSEARTPKEVRPPSAVLSTLRSSATEDGLRRTGTPKSELGESPPSSIGHRALTDSQPSTINYQPLVKLTDFGIGQVVSEECLAGITRAGFTQTILGSSSTSHTGTQLYMAPELLAGKPASIRSDIYALGVVLYQLLVGDFTRPVTTDWAADIEDQLLREDLQHCFAGKPEDRFAGAGQLARQLRRRPERRTELEQRVAEKAALERAAYRRGMMRTASVAAVIVAVIAGLAMLALNQTRRAKAAAQAEQEQRLRAEKEEHKAKDSELLARENLYAADMNLAYQAWQEHNRGRALELLDKHRPEQKAEMDLRGWEWRYIRGLCRSEALYTFGQHSNLSQGVYSVAISPDDRYLATADIGSGEVRLWDRELRRTIEILETDDGGRSVAFSPDGKLLAYGTGHHGVRLWDIHQHRQVAQFPASLSYNFYTPTVGFCFSPDGRQLAIGGFARKVVVWDVATQTHGPPLDVHNYVIQALFFSPDGQTLITAHALDSTIRVWSLATGQQLALLTNNTAGLGGVALSPDGKILATGDFRGWIRIWDLARQRQVAELTNHTDWVSALAFSRDGKTLASASVDYLINLYDTGNWRKVGTLRGSQDEVYGIVFTSDGKTLFSGTKDGKILAWDGRPPAPRVEVLMQPDKAEAFGLSSSGIPWCLNTNHMLNFRDPKTLRKLPEHPMPKSEPLARGKPVAVSPGMERAAVATGPGTIYLLDLAGERQPVALAGFPSEQTIELVEFSPDGKLLAAAAAGQGLRVWDLGNPEVPIEMPKPSPSILMALCFTTNGQMVAVGHLDGTVELWNIPRKQRLAGWKAHNGGVSQSGMAFLPDGRRLATVGYDSKVKLWDLERIHEPLSFGRTLNAYWSAAVSPDGERIAAGTGNGQIKIWNRSGQELVTLTGANDWVDRNTPDWTNLRWVVGLAFLPPDGNTLISATQCEARLWRAPSWAAIEEADGRERKDAQALVAARQRDEGAAMERLVARQREEAVAAERERTLRAQDPGVIKEWLVLLPIPLTNRDGAAGLQEEQVARESQLRPRAGDRVPIGKRELAWRALQLKDYLIDFVALSDGQYEWCVAYAVCYLESEQNRTNLVMKIGSDDHAKIYLNGQEVYRITDPTSWEPDRDSVGGLSLKAGLNVLVFKVVNNDGPWGGSIRFTDVAGQPVKGIRVTLDPGASNDNSR